MANMMMQQFRNEIEAYLARTGMKPSTFGRRFVGDPNFVSRIRGGGEARLKTIEAVQTEMLAYPDGKPSPPASPAA